MSILLVFLLTLRLPTIIQKPKSIKEGYEMASLGPVSGKYNDAQYIIGHKIPVSSFTPISNGDDGNYPISNAFNEDKGQRWLSKEPESNDFHPSITIDLKEPVLFDGFLYDPVYRSREPVRYFDGFPHKLKVYTALNDGPLELNVVFTGDPVDPWTRIQFIMPKPIKCTKIQLEFYDISEAEYFGTTEKKAAAEAIILLQTFENDVAYYEKVSGKYENSVYLNYHKIPASDFDVSSTGDKEGCSVSNAFDDDGESSWVSNQAESDSFHASISITLHKPVLFDAFLFNVKSHTTGTVSKTRYLDGFPTSMKVYTALNDEPFKLSTVFYGTPSTDVLYLQYVLLKPVECTRVKLEFIDVSQFEGGDKLAATDGLTLLQALNPETAFYDKVSGNYDNANYVAFHKIDPSTFTATADCKDNNYISYAFDDNVETSWVSKDVETSTFKPSIFVEFNEEVSFGGFIFVAKSHSSGFPKKKYLDGFPSSLKLYTALNDEPLKLTTTFIGTPSTDKLKLQYVLNEPVKCKRIQLEFHGVSQFNGKDEFYAATDGITFLRNENENLLTCTNVNGDYANQNYVEYHKVPSKKIKFSSSGDRDGNPIDNAFDDDGNTEWISKEAQSDTFHPSITVNFEEPILLEAFLYDAKIYSHLTTFKFYGYPYQVGVYTALNDEPFKLNSVFQGDPGSKNQRGQYVLASPVNCTKVKLVLYDISDYDKSGKIAATRGLTFLQTFIENPTRFQEATGDYTDQYYLTQHTVPTTSFTVTSSGDETGKLLQYIFNDNDNEVWVSQNENTDDFHASITVNFVEITSLEGFIIKATNGYPLRLNVYTSSNNEPLTLNTEFAGIPTDSWRLIQFVFPNPVECDKIKLEFVQVTNLKASVTHLTLLKKLNYEYLGFSPVTGFLSNDHYVETHRIPHSNMNVSSTGDRESDIDEFIVTNIIDDVHGTVWISSFENTNDKHASICINFHKPIILEAFILTARLYSKWPNDYIVGFPTKLKITASVNNANYSALYAGSGDSSKEKYQFVLPTSVTCSKLELEFIEVTEDHEFSNKKRVPILRGIDIIGEEFPDFSQSDYTDDLSSIHVNESFVLDHVSDTKFIDINLPKDDEYLFIVEKDFSFDNVSFSCEHSKLSAIKSQDVNHVIIEKCSFVSCRVKNDNENGGAINFIDCGINCGRSEFIDCSSPYKGGGVSIRIRKEIKDKIKVDGCNFSKCSASNGGGCYVYSSTSSSISFMNCSFAGNKISSSVEPTKTQYSTGSALFMMAKKALIRKCKFIDNEGESACSIINSITGEENVKKNDGRLAQLSDTQSVSISECKFEIGRNSKCSLFYIGGSKGVNAELKDSVFTGVLSNGAYHISGKSLGNQARKLLIKSCRFSSSFNKAFNSDNNYMSIDLKDNHFNYNEFREIKENKLPWKVVVFIVVPVVAVAVIVVIAVIIIKLKKKPQDDQNDEHEMSAEIHESLIDQSLL